ncbi:MAG: TVP38/TMEM64 family protein [Pseudomonadales bacterium]|nr:TVP38/TMEM64 family protein [Pseudomonadales bacterium]MDP7596332.1 TVP38/TMEM64 family protein [Pseudomonadales bacterium]HJN49991.1 TVP38/TMEM64 family protein [Pseudomonadales bacterium]
MRDCDENQDDVACFDNSVGLRLLLFRCGEILTLEYFKSQRILIDQAVAQAPLKTGLLFLVIYVAVTALSLPGATLMTLVAGGVFGLLGGMILVSLASTIGATLAMLVSRFIFRDIIQTKFARQLSMINEGMAKEGAFYLFTLRLVPVVPFFVINLAMGVTHISTRVFFLVSQIGMLAGTLVYVNAGTRIAEIDSLTGILSPAIVLSFLLLGIFPLLLLKRASIVLSVASMAARDTVRRSLRKRVFDSLATMRKIQVFRLDLPSNLGSAAITEIHAS